MKVDINSIKVQVKVLESQKLKAIIGLDFGDFVVRGFRVMESQFDNPRGDKLWLTPPSYLGGGRYHPIFFMPEKSLWEALQAKIWDEYYKETETHYKKRMDLKNDDIIEISSNDLPP